MRTLFKLLRDLAYFLILQRVDQVYKGIVSDFLYLAAVETVPMLTVKSMHRIRPSSHTALQEAGRLGYVLIHLQQMECQ